MGRILGLLGGHRAGWRAICTIAATIAASAAALGCECDISLPSISGPYSPELIIEGVVVPQDSHSAAMRIDHAWKGAVDRSVSLTFLEGDAGNCDSPPPYGKPIMIAVTRDKSQIVHFSACSIVYGDDPQFRADLEAYKKKTESMVEQARTVGRAGRLALAAYLREGGESHRALDLYRSLFDEDNDITLLIPIALLEGSIYDGDPKPTLRLLRQRAPASEEWQRKVAHTAFEAACELDASRKDWSKVVVRTGERCKFENAQLENANFDDADLRGAWFKDSNLKGANFKAANLFGASFDNSSLIGAQYDCKTQYNARYFNPTEVGMINVDGSCSAPSP
jgi:hypothetical protein